MEEVETQGSIEGVVPPETESVQDTTQAVTQEESKTDQQDTDWIKRLRRDREEAIRLANEERKEKEFLKKILLEQAQAESPTSRQEPEEDLIQELAKEEYVPGDKVAKALRKMEEKFERKEQEREKRYAAQQQNSLFNDLQREFPDFHDVVNSETLKTFEETNPRLANAIAKSNDPYMIAIQSYEYIKAKGLHSSDGPSRRIKETEAKIEQNKKTVQSPPIDKRPMAQAFNYGKLSADQKKSLYEEMYSNAQRAGMGY